MSRTTPKAPALVSIGYEGRSVSEFVEALSGHGVRTLIDVRLTPLSRKRGFSKTALSEALHAAGIEYVHEPALGNPKSNREAFRRGSQSARAIYERLLRTVAAPAYQATLDRARAGGAAVMCFEREHGDCHRATITDRLRTDDPRIGVVTV